MAEPEDEVGYNAARVCCLVWYAFVRFRQKFVIVVRLWSFTKIVLFVIPFKVRRLHTFSYILNVIIYKKDVICDPAW